MTAQIGEVLIIDGEGTHMAFCPPLPLEHPRIVERGKHPGPGRFMRRPPVSIGPLDLAADTGIFESTACWRGYQGTWEIRDGRFFLVDLRGRFGLLEGEPLFADWFSGVLRIPQGRLLKYVHMGFGSVYERELHIKIEHGVVTTTRVTKNDERSAADDQIGWRNLPGRENRFPGDDEL